jgi:hypothetical protein
MIQIFGSDHKAIGLFKDYDAIFKHINTLENSKLMESSAFPKDIWTFVIFTNKRLSYIYHKTLERSFSKVGKEAYENELDLIEISKGDYQNPIQIPVTADVNVQELRKRWCQEYCDSHDYVIVEYNNNLDSHCPIEAIPVSNNPSNLNELPQDLYATLHASL